MSKHLCLSFYIARKDSLKYALQVSRDSATSQRLSSSSFEVTENGLPYFAISQQDYVGDQLRSYGGYLRY